MKTKTRPCRKRQLKVSALALLVYMVYGYTSPAAEAGSGQDPGELIRIIGAHLEGRLDEDPNSGYQLLMKALLPTQTHYFQFSRYPLTRAIRDFKENKRVCIIPSSEKAVRILTKDAKIELLESSAIDVVTSHIISAPNKPVFTTVSALEKHKIAVQHGVVASRFLTEKSTVQVTRTPNDLTALRMVLAGRVDAMYGWFPDIYIIAEKNGLSLPHFNPQLILFKTTTHLVCKKFGGNERLFNIVNTRIKDLKRRGELQNILGKHARIVKD